jgi:hypothetical protein
MVRGKDPVEGELTESRCQASPNNIPTAFWNNSPDFTTSATSASRLTQLLNGERMYEIFSCPPQVGNRKRKAFFVRENFIYQRSVKSTSWDGFGLLLSKDSTVGCRRQNWLRSIVW